VGKEGRPLKDAILSLSERFEDRVISMRRHLHALAEPSFGEKETQAALAAYLRGEGISHRCVRGSTGIIGLIRGGPGATVALRTDMDALNITERTGLAFASRHAGYMHACGHDAHMAIVLGAGLVLKRLGRDLPGNVRLIFQPAEETSPGGAVTMIKAGALKSPRVSAVLGLHVDPVIRAGKVAVNAGPISAAADEFGVEIRGKGGHGSSPHKGIDAIVVAADFVMSLQTIVSRRVSPLDSVVVSVGRIEGGEKSNIIAEKVVLDGTIRTRTAGLRRRVPRMIRSILRSTCAAYGATGRFEFREGYPPVVCDPALAGLVTSACAEILGRRRTVTSPGLEMGGEDFAYYARMVPGVMMFVGTGGPPGSKRRLLHHAEFDIDESVLKTGVAALAYSAYRCLVSGGRMFGGKGGRNR
jgi:amidohydrolase